MFLLFSFSIFNSNQKPVKRMQRKIISPYITKLPFSSFLPKPSNDVHNIFKSKDCTISSSTDLSNIILTPTSLLDTTDDQTTQMINT